MSLREKERRLMSRLNSFYNYDNPGDMDCDLEELEEVRNAIANSDGEEFNEQEYLYE